MQNSKYYVFSILLSIWMNIVCAQQPNYVIQSNESGSTKQYQAYDFISLKPGFTYTATAGTSFLAGIQAGVPPLPTSNTYAKPDGTITTNPSEGGVVGSIPGSFNVNQSGAAIYSIPVECPAGINGVQPNISLEYNSHAGDGPLGVGWGIQGLSSITKTLKNIYNDNAIRGIDMENDVFLLDGNKLFVKQNSTTDVSDLERGAIPISTTNELNEYLNTHYNDLLYMAPGDVFETQTVSYSKIETYGHIPNITITQSYYPISWVANSVDPRKFILTTKQGIVIEYSSKYAMSAATYEDELAHEFAYEWLISKITDTNGNFMTFTYQHSDQQSVIKEINYTGNGSNLPFYKIMFSYEIKETIKHNRYGRIYKENKFLLKDIQITSGTTTLKQYDLNYALRKEKYYLEEIKLTGMNSQMLNSTMFEWGADNDVINVSSSITPTTSSDQILIENESPAPHVSRSERHWLGADVNGDGKDEVINIYPGKVATSDPDFYVTMDHIDIYESSINSGQISLTNDIHYVLESSFSYENIKSANPSILTGDINGDSKEDLILPILSATNKVQFQIMGGTTYERNLLYSSQRPVCTVADINNDGIDEIIYLENGKTDPNSYFVHGEICYTKNDGSKIWVPISIRIDLGLTALPISIIPTDEDNDGLTDLIITYAGGYKYYKNEGNPNLTLDYRPVTFSDMGFSDQFNGNAKTIEKGDFDGDGATDFLINVSGSKYWDVFLNNSDSFTAIYESGGSSSNTIENVDCVITDYNKDDKSDVILVNKIYNSSHVYIQTIISWYASTGDEFVVSKTFTTTDINYSFRKFNCKGDFNGDGREDIISYGSDIYNGGTKLDRVFLQQAFNNNFEANRITNITTGLGGTTHIAYQPLTYSITPDNKPFYNKGVGSVYPIIDLEVPLYCVSKVIEPDGVGGSTAMELTYSEARAEVTGRGFLGFKSMTISNLSSNQKIVSVADMDMNLLIPQKVTTEVNTINNAPISKTEHHFSNSKNGKIFTSLPLQTVENDYLNNLLQTTDYISFDNYGNLDSLKITKGSVILNLTTSYVQKGSWCPNKPYTETITRKVGAETYCRTKSYAYDNLGNLTEEITDPGDANQLKVEYKNWTPFGKYTRKETSANGIIRSVVSVISSNGLFTESVTDVMGQTTTYDWDATRGLLNSETNRIGTTSYTYNGFGRLIRTDFPDGTYSEQTAQWASPDNAYGAKFYVYQRSSGSTPVYIWFDGLQREIVKEFFSLKGRKSRMFTSFRADGKTDRVSAPTYSNEPSIWDAIYDYYADGRLHTVITPLGANTTNYNGRVTSVVTPEGTSQTTLNSSGQVISNTVNGKTVAYEYYASGQLKTATPDGSGAIVIEYDLQGNRTKLTDPDAGITQAYYNGLGELKWEKLTNNATQGEITTTYNYSDAMGGLLESRVRNGEVTNFGYDSYKRLQTVEIAGQHKQTYVYGDFDRIESLTELVNGTKTLVKQIGYDDYGRVTRETFPSGYYTENHYDEYGNLYKVTDSSTPARVIWEATEANARGQMTKIMKGTKETVYGYDDTKGQLTSIFASGVVSYNYGYDTKNNLAFRTDNLINQKEIFTYDTQNRLTNWDICNASTQSLLKANSISYDVNTGNITGKSDLNIPGNVMFNYDNPDRLHALTGITPKPDVVSNDELAVTYTDFRKIKTLTDGTKQYNLTYGVDDQRRMSVQIQGGNTLTKYYFGNYEEEISGTNTRKIHYLSGAIYIDNTNTADSLYYVYTDNQGSVIALTDESGAVKRKYAYDPWGARRNPANWTQPDNLSNLIISRGYTGHEHLDMFNIINMNGRVYDPLTAMFFSPDPFIQSPGDWSNFNRYSYCMNNPTRYTDPSGYIANPYVSTVGTEPAYYYEGTCIPINAGGGSGVSVLDWWDAQHQGSISYNWGTRQYEYSNGNVATYGEAMDQLLNGNLDYKISFDGKNASQFYDYYSKGYNLYAVKAFGRINYVAVLGDLGKIYYSSDGAIGFSGMFVGAVIGLGTGEGGNQVGQAYLKYEADYVNRTRTQGSLVWYNSDGSEVARYKATSGSGNPKYFTLPVNKYTASNYRITSDQKFMRHGIGFKVTLGPSSVWDADKGAYRTALLIHPARYDGTAGCIGLIGDYSQISDFQTRIKQYLQINNTINVIVEY